MDTGSSPYPSIIILAALILGSAYFAAAETAFASANKIRIKNYADDGDMRAKKASFVINNFDKALTTILVGVNILHTACASLATVIATRLWGVWAVTYSTIVITIVVFLIGEMIPKSFASSLPEKCAVAFSGSLCFLMKLFTPLNFVFTSISKLFLRMFSSKREPTVTEDELYDIIDTIKEEGSIEAEKGRLIRSALEFDDVTAQDILTARVDIAAIDADMSQDEIIAFIKSHKYSRLPVYENTIDNIIGVLGIRKYLKHYLRDGSADLRALLDPPHFVHKSIPIDNLLKEMSRSKLHMSVVTDDYGGTMGIVTVEDILEELVGEIWDEDDVVVEDFKPIGGGRFEVNGDMTAADVFEKIGFEDFDPDELGHKSISAWAFEHFDCIPKEGSHFKYGALDVSVRRMNNMRIKKLTLRLDRQETPNDDSESSLTERDQN